MTADETTENPAPGFKDHPEYRIGIKEIPKRIRAFFGGNAIADSTRAVLLNETQHRPAINLAFVSKLNSLCRMTFEREMAALSAVSRIEQGEAVEYEVIPL